MTTFTPNLPQDIFAYMKTNNMLDIFDLASCSSVCRYWCQIIPAITLNNFILKYDEILHISQQQAVQAIISQFKIHDSIQLYARVGFGKTRTSIMCSEYLLDMNIIDFVIVLCPNYLICSTWNKEYKKLHPHIFDGKRNFRSIQGWIERSS